MRPGIIAASLGADGVVARVADVSGRMTSDAWAVGAVQLAVEWLDPDHLRFGS
ncbi:hypothetical protein [Mycobacterium haemophilum]